MGESMAQSAVFGRNLGIDFIVSLLKDFTRGSIWKLTAFSQMIVCLVCLYFISLSPSWHGATQVGFDCSS